jgi:hypothetical protein
MRDTAIADTVNLERRIKELKKEYAADPHETTEAQIIRLEDRLRRRVQEAEALAIATTRF